LFSALALLKLSSRTDTVSLVFFLLVSIGFYLLAEACLMDGRAGETELTRVAFLRQLAAPCIIPFAIHYLRKLRNNNLVIRSLGMIWLVVPAVMTTASLVMYLMIGEPAIISFLGEVNSRGIEALREYRGSVEYAFYILASYGLRIVLAVEFLILMGYLTHLAIKERFSLRDLIRFFAGGETKVIHLQTILLTPVFLTIWARIFNFNFTLAQDKLLCVSGALIICFFLANFSFTALFGAKKMVSRKEMRLVSRYNYSQKSKAQVVEEMMNGLLEEAETEALERVQAKIGKNLHIEEFKSEEQSPERSEIASKIFDAVTETWDEEDLLGKFQRLMRDEMLFLKPGLSLEDVADKLDTNKFYISKMVNNTFNMGFPEVVNILRVDYAEQYILNHPGAKQTEIATKCGFFSASTFNTIFKKVTGMTPKMWVAAKEASDQQQ
jgi:AraC-like DNA-binding protein